MQASRKKSSSYLPTRVRVSVGSAIILGLLEGRLDAEPTTAYLMTYKAGKCTANCGFCPQARTSRSKAELLSRITWPAFPTRAVLRGIETAFNDGKIRRVCIQALNYPRVISHLVALVTAIKRYIAIPISASCQPLNMEDMHQLAKAGVNRLGIALDAATERLFSEVKGAVAGGPYVWGNQFKLLREAVEVFGKGNVSTHLIIGLGESEEEAVQIVQRCVDMGILPALFAFTPISGTAMEHNSQPGIAVFRRVQLARHLIVTGAARCENMRFDADDRIADFSVEKAMLTRLVETGAPFLTSGCPGCNRPFYNEKPSGPIYNYPRNLSSEEASAIKRQLGLS